jgi:putative tricarboxylic transport membrane protein
MEIPRTLRLLSGRGLIGPLVTAACAALVLAFLRSGNVSTLLIQEDGFGPYSWPKVMLIGIAVSALLLAIARWRGAGVRSGGDLAGEGNIPDPAAVNSARPADLPLAFTAVLLYGAAMVYIGFALATFAFLAAWILCAGKRNYLTTAVTSALGTVGILYLFVKIAYLPLPKGEVFFDDLTVMLYRLIGIY